MSHNDVKKMIYARIEDLKDKGFDIEIEILRGTGAILYLRGEGNYRKKLSPILKTREILTYIEGILEGLDLINHSLQKAMGE